MTRWIPGSRRGAARHSIYERVDRSSARIRRSAAKSAESAERDRAQAHLSFSSSSLSAAGPGGMMRHERSCLDQQYPHRQWKRPARGERAARPTPIDFGSAAASRRVITAIDAQFGDPVNAAWPPGSAYVRRRRICAGPSTACGRLAWCDKHPARAMVSRRAAAATARRPLGTGAHRSSPFSTASPSSAPSRGDRLAPAAHHHLVSTRHPRLPAADLIQNQWG